MTALISRHSASYFVTADPASGAAAAPAIFANDEATLFSVLDSVPVVRDAKRCVSASASRIAFLKPLESASRNTISSPKLATKKPPQCLSARVHGLFFPLRKIVRRCFAALRVKYRASYNRLARLDSPLHCYRSVFFSVRQKRAVFFKT